MARLFRPHIPLKVRCQVAERQLRERDPEKHGYVVPGKKTAGNRLRILLPWLANTFGENIKLELHHRPALLNREWVARRNDYDPPANSPDHLIYLPEDDHDIETRVRGVGAQRSDLSQARYLKKVARNRETRPKASGFPKRPPHVKHSAPFVGSRSLKDPPKSRWPKRPFAKRRKA
jgi:hypothetical protein